MRFLAVLAFCFSLLLAPKVDAQQPLQRDLQATAVLTRMVAATGWNARAVPRDVIGSGTVTRYIADSKDTVGITLKVKSPQCYRTDVSDSKGVTSTIVNGERAAVLAPDGAKVISAHAARAMRPMAFPFFSELVAFTDGQVSVRYVGPETVRGELAYRIDVDREPAKDDPAADIRRLTDHLVVWVSASSWLPLQMEYVRVSQDNAYAVLSRVRSFSDYRVVNGLAIPFRQEELVQGRLLYTLQLTNVSFNNALSDADFTLLGVQK